jgi:hypothetical protein
MFRSASSFNRFHIFVALVMVLVFGAAAFFLTRQQLRQQPIPNTGSRSVVDAAKVVNSANSASAAAAPKSLDIGGGYRLETDAQGGRIVAPETHVRPADQSPASAAPARPSTYYHREDIGAGYVLEINPQGGQIVAPSRPLKGQAPAEAVRKVDIGSGYWLVTGPDGGQIVKEGSR